MRPNARFPTLLTACLVVVLAGLPAQADEDAELAAAQAYAREQLVRSARMSVDPRDPKAGGLEELRRGLAEKQALYQRLANDEYKRALQLLGERSGTGLIREAARLYRWLAAPSVKDEPAPPLPSLPGLRDAAADWRRLVGEAKADERKWLDPLLLALVHGQELEAGSDIRRTALDKEGKRVAASVVAMKAEQAPRTLLVDTTVEEKAKRAEELRAIADTYARWRVAIAAALDRMVRAERMLREDAGRLSFQIDQARSKAEKTTAVSEELSRYQLQELVNQQLQRLLYVAVWRADLLAQHYAEAEDNAKEEADAADDAYEKFEGALSRTRRERQLQTLDAQARELRGLQKDAQARATEGVQSERPTYQRYAEALEHLLALNRSTQDAVALRRALEARAKPDCDPDEEGCLPPDVPEVVEPQPKEETASPASKDPLRRFRDPQAETIDATYVANAIPLLEEPAWSAELAAKHFVAVDDRIQALEGALALVRDTAPLRTQFADTEKAADNALARVRELVTTQRLWSWPWGRVKDHREKHIEPVRSAFQETLRSIEQERTTVASDLEVFRDYRARLLELGPRSFKIRVQRTLDADRLEAAYDDVDATVDKTSRWLTFQGDDHAGTFVQRNWLMLLLCVALLVGSFLAVRFGRHALDKVLRAMASRVPALRSEPVTVRAEEAQAKRERAEQEAAAKKAEADALREVSKEEADRQQKMGEGGYAGGDDA